MSDDTRPIITSDGNQTLAVIEKFKRQLSDNPKDYPVLTGAHLMGGNVSGEAVDTGVATQLDALLSRDYRAQVVGGYLYKILRDSNAVLLHEVHLLGRDGFVQLLKETMRPDSMAAGLADKELERSWEIYDNNVRRLAKLGAHFRRRRDWRG